MGRSNPRQAAVAHPALRDFVAPLIDGRGLRSTLGWTRAEREGLGVEAARRYAEQFARVLRRGGPFPEPMTLWKLGCSLEAIHPWCAAPLVLFGGAHLAAFVDVMVTANRNSIVPARLEQLVRAAPAAVQGHSENRRIWQLSSDERTAFLPPDVAKARANLLHHDDIVVARVLAEAYEIGIDVQRRAIAEHLVRWFRDPHRRQLELFDILEYGTRRVEGFA